jgi:hypothetical protein
MTWEGLLFHVDTTGLGEAKDGSLSGYGLRMPSKPGAAAIASHGCAGVVALANTTGFDELGREISVWDGR